MSEEDKIKGLFSGFDPDLSSDSRFMSRLESNMRAVDLIKEHNRELLKMNRKAVMIAAVVGFVCGFLFSMAMPAIGEAMMKLRQTVEAGSFLSVVAHNYLPITWAIIATVSRFIAINTFELSLFLLERRR